MKRSVSALIFVLLAPAAGAQSIVPDAEQYTVRFELRRFMPGLDANLQTLSPESGEGTLIDIPKDLGVEDRSTLDIRASLQLGLGHKIRLGFARLDYDGDKEIESQITFEGTVYKVNTRVVTSVKGNLLNADFEWDFFHGNRGYFGALIGIRAFDGDTVLVAPDEGIRKLVSLHVPVPVLGVVARIYAGHLSISGELSGLTIGKTGNLYDLELGVHVDAVKHVGAGLGYRLLSMHGEGTRKLIDFKLGGLYFETDINF